MRLGTIFFLFIALTTVWLSMAETLQTRHLDLDRKLRTDVSGLWGSYHLQRTATLTDGSRVKSAEILADLDLEYRKKGHYWYSTYKVRFQADYRLGDDLPPDAMLNFPLPAGSGLFNDFEVTVDEQIIENYDQQDNIIQIQLPVGAEKVRVRYLGRGSGEWWYDFESGAPKDLSIVVTTNFQELDFIDGGVSPDQRQAVDGGWSMEWRFRNLLSGSKIGIAMPERPNPGPALINICQFGPLGLLLFFAALATCSIAKGKCPHPMHFFLMGAGFFSFHLLLVYVADTIGLVAAFCVASIVAVLLNYSYARKALGEEFALSCVLPASLLYLVLYSAAFLAEGYRGLFLVVLMVFSLFLLMRISAAVDWHALEAKKSPCRTPPPAL